MYGEAVSGAESGSNGWWLQQLLHELAGDRSRLARLRRYLHGDPPRGEVPRDQWAEYETFRTKSRNNLAALVVHAPLDKLHINSFRTAAAGDDNGDAVVAGLWTRDKLALVADMMHTDYLAYGRGMLLADPLTGRTRYVPPTQGWVELDDALEPVAGVTLHRDRLQGVDVAQVWLPGRVVVAARERAVRTLDKRVPLTATVGRGWRWWYEKPTGLDVVPLTLWQNAFGAGEFEHHTDVLDRINHMLLQRVVIATMQAFRQRGIQGDLPEHDEQGVKIDYNELFPSSPGALWRLPAGAEFWESSPGELQGLLSAVKDDVRDLSAQSRTPMSYFSPDGANQSATGASMQMDSHTSKVEDHQQRASTPWARHVSLLLRLAGEEARSDPQQIEVDWTPAQRLSLTERMDAASKAPSAGVPTPTIWREILQLSPRTIARMEQELSEQRLQAAVDAAMAAAAAPAAEPVPA